MADINPEIRKQMAWWIRQRRSAMGLSVAAAARLAGVARNTWTSAEDSVGVHDSTLGRIEGVLAWQPGSVIAILAGEMDGPPPGRLHADADRDWSYSEVPVGTGVDPLDLSDLTPEDREYIRSLAERLRQQRGE